MDTTRLPEYEPGELLETSMLQRLQLLEAHVKQLHQSNVTNVKSSCKTTPPIKCHEC